MLRKANFFSGNPLDRKSHLRANATALGRDRSLVFNDSKFLSANARIRWLKEDELALAGRNLNLASVYLGKDGNLDQHYWCVDVTGNENAISKCRQFGEFLPKRPNAFDLPQFDASVLAQASSVMDWNLRHKFCPSCGSTMASTESGYKLKCNNDSCVSNRSVQNYCHIRTDSVVICNVVSPDGSKILLGRQKSWPNLRYSCVAGFLEPGESIEECAVREVLEETGIPVKEVLYHSSQPWPFPSHIMLGCTATATSMDIDILSRDKELEDAKWWTLSQIAKALKGQSDELTLAPPYAIAHTLIKKWADNNSIKSSF